MQASFLRSVRKLHRNTGILLFALFFIMAITGLLLGWKKNSFGLIQPPTASGTSTQLSEWKPLEKLNAIADSTLLSSAGQQTSTQLDRIDVRKDKGIVKFVYIQDYWEVQLDGATGKPLQISQRRSDLIEDLHDGSFFDLYFQTKGEPIKLIYTLIMGMALIIFTITGFWLWYGPKQIRRKKAEKSTRSSG
jgi:uncharacterized iron-regulated membrane protein